MGVGKAALVPILPAGLGEPGRLAEPQGIGSTPRHGAAPEFLHHCRLGLCSPHPASCTTGAWLLPHQQSQGLALPHRSQPSCQSTLLTSVNRTLVIVEAVQRAPGEQGGGSPGSPSPPPRVALARLYALFCTGDAFCTGSCFITCTRTPPVNGTNLSVAAPLPAPSAPANQTCFI